jgi:hypothetical protein
MSRKRELVIGIGYKAGVGKSTVAHHLSVQHKFVEFALADALKDTLAPLFGWDREDLDDQDFKKTVDEFWGITPRQALQTLGTDCVRKAFGDDFWVKRLELAMRDEHRKLVVITDVRRKNEAQAIKAMGGILWLIHRPITDGTAGTHITETEMDSFEGWDEVINNDGTLELLKARVEVALAKAMLKKLESKE